MDTKKKRRISPTTKPLPVLFTKEDRGHLEGLADMWNCSLGEAVRRCIEDVSRRVEEERMAPRLDQIRDNQMETLKTLILLSERVTDNHSNVKEMLENKEPKSTLRARVEALHARLDSVELIKSHAELTHCWLRAFINSGLNQQTREKVEAEAQRLHSELE